MQEYYIDCDTVSNKLKFGNHEAAQHPGRRRKTKNFHDPNKATDSATKAAG
jgi:hypothetical protein